MTAAELRHRDRSRGPRTRIRPTARGLTLAVLAIALWLLGDITALAIPRSLAAGLLLALAGAGLCLGVAAIGLALQRQAVDLAVPVGSRARIMLRLNPGAWFARVPLGRGAVREHLPAALGGTGDLALAPQMAHTLPVTARGAHRISPVDVLIRDPLGLAYLRRTWADDATVIGLPLIEQLPPGTLDTHFGNAADGSIPATGSGELGPQARVYATGDDIRRIHWRATARTGRLMTREDDPQLDRSAVVILAPGACSRGDVESSANGSADPDGPDELRERILDHAASLLPALARDGWRVDAATVQGERITGLAPGGTLDLDHLIAIATSADDGDSHDPGEPSAGEHSIDRLSADVRALPVILTHDTAAAPTAADSTADPAATLQRLTRIRDAALPARGRRSGGGLAILLHTGPSAPIEVDRLGDWTALRASTGTALVDILTARASSGTPTSAVAR